MNTAFLSFCDAEPSIINSGTDRQKKPNKNPDQTIHSIFAAHLGKKKKNKSAKIKAKLLILKLPEPLSSRLWFFPPKSRAPRHCSTCHSSPRQPHNNPLPREGERRRYRGKGADETELKPIPFAAWDRQRSAVPGPARGETRWGLTLQLRKRLWKPQKGRNKVPCENETLPAHSEGLLCVSLHLPRLQDLGFK